MRLRALGNIWYDGHFHTAGSIVDVPEASASALVSAGTAEAVDNPGIEPVMPVRVADRDFTVADPDFEDSFTPRRPKKATKRAKK
jgi:hypothetical protein